MKKKQLVEIHKKLKKKHIVYIIRKKKVIIGIDLGIKEYAITFNGKEFKHYKNFNKVDNELKRLRKQLLYDIDINDRRNYRTKELLNNKLIKLIEENIKNIINDILSDNNIKSIKIEDLNIKEMKESNKLKLKNSKYINKMIDECRWDLFKELLQKECDKRNINLILVPQYYPSSKLCNKCGNYLDIRLEERTYICPYCGQVIDRDENASINIRNYNLHK